MGRTANTPNHIKLSLNALNAVLKGYENIPLTLSVKGLRAIEDVLGVNFNIGSLASEDGDSKADVADNVTPALKPSIAEH